jgi:hypothetical protein
MKKSIPIFLILVMSLFLTGCDIDKAMLKISKGIAGLQDMTIKSFENKLINRDQELAALEGFGRANKAVIQINSVIAAYRKANPDKKGFDNLTTDQILNLLTEISKAIDPVAIASVLNIKDAKIIDGMNRSLEMVRAGISTVQMILAAGD